MKLYSYQDENDSNETLQSMLDQGYLLCPDCGEDYMRPWDVDPEPCSCKSMMNQITNITQEEAYVFITGLVGVK